MPFKSEAQRKYLWAKHPKIAERWAHEYGTQKHLPEHVKDKEEKKSSSEGTPMFIERVVDTITAAGIAMEKMETELQKKASAQQAYADKIPGVVAALVQYSRIDDTPEEKQAMTQWLSTPEGALDALTKLAAQIVEEKNSSIGAQQVDASGRVVRNGQTKRASYTGGNSPYVGARSSQKAESDLVFERGLGFN